MRIKHKVGLRIGDDPTLKDLLFALDDSLAEVAIDTYLRMASGKFNIAASGTEALSLGDVDAVKGLFIKVDGDVTVDINGLGAIQLRRSATTAGTVAKLFMEADITSVSITNTDGTAAVNGVWCVWGDLAA